MAADFYTEYHRDLWEVDAGRALSLVRMLPPGSRTGQRVHGARAGLTVEASVLAVLVDAVGRLSWLVESALTETTVAFPTSFFTVLDDLDAPRRPPAAAPDPEAGLLNLLAIANGG